uniref:Uncharacterized protein n=1 Tax=Rhizophora mucronata TaxID=61149 RepID=A0A2P2KE55_RHIMU
MFYAYNMLVLSKTFLTYLDYVFGDCKFGRNAQSITKTRWMHHSSFIWNYEIRNMAYLKIPARAPKYRMARDHAEFVCRMKEYLPRSDFFKKTLKALETHFTMKPVNLDAVGENDGEEMPPSTRLLSQQELEDGSQCPLESVAG